MLNSISTLAIGSEILDGRVLDSNSNYIAQRLNELDLRLQHSLSCDDERETILASLEFLSKSSSFIIITGGLGPTSDDITREVLASFAGLSLYQDDCALQELKALFQKRQRPFLEINARQAFFPQGARIISNPTGTAPGFICKTRSGVTLASLPGVPSEMKGMLPDVLAEVERLTGPRAAMHRLAFRTFGLPESSIGKSIESLRLPDEITISYRAHFPIVDLLLKTYKPGLLTAEMASRISCTLGADHVFSEDLGKNLPQIVHELLCQQNLSLSLAESCTAGLLGKLLTDLPGSSRFLLGGAIAYSNDLKQKILGVDPTALERHGAVSHEVARLMAQGAQQRFNSDLALSITGIAGPDGGSTEKPVGTFFVGLADRTSVDSWHFFLPLAREPLRLYAAFAALDTLRKKRANLL